MQKSVHTRSYKVLCERLVAARHAAGLTQTQLAKRLGRPQSFVAKFERGERRIDLIELVEIADVLAIDVGRIIRAVKCYNVDVSFTSVANSGPKIEIAREHRRPHTKMRLPQPIEQSQTGDSSEMVLNKRIGLDP